MMQSLVLVGLLAPFVTSFDSSQKDPNTYPWGENPNNGYKMYWKDSPNILSSLKEFASLYIKVHGCVWSEYGLGVSYDDDGENHDGDEQWYLTRIQPFRANAAFSLYGILRGTSGLGRKCRKGTYINTFFTYEGADTLLQALGSSVQTAFPDGNYGSAYCYDYESEDDGSDNGDRQLNSGSGDGDDQSMTMGCSADANFVVATFDGSACDGTYFLNTTDDLSDYNSAMDHLSCSQVWNYRKAMKNSRKLADAADDYYADEGADEGDDEAAANDDGNAYNNGDDDSSSTTYGSIAETLLSSSFACDITLFPNGLCPDPYGLKAKYATNIAVSARKSKSIRLKNWQTPMMVFSWLFFLAGIAFAGFGYYMLRKENANTKGGGLGGWFRQIWTDSYRLCCRSRNKEKVNSSRELQKSRSKKQSNAVSPDKLEATETLSPSGRKKSRSGRKKDKYHTEGPPEKEIV